MSRETIATLVVKGSGGDEERFILRNQDALTIGREEGNDLVVDETGVSRAHASFAASLNGVVVADLSSLNGTFVNGQKISGMKDLSSGDVVQVGLTTFTVHFAGQEASVESKDSSRARAMTAQMKPVAVSVLVLKVQLREGMVIPTEQLSSWTKQVETMVHDFGGTIDKTVNTTVVAVWVGDDAKSQALRAIRTFQRVAEETPSTNENADVFASISSGLGLSGARASSDGGKDVNVIGDPANIAFQLASIHPASSGSQVIFDKSTKEHIEGGDLSILPLGNLEGFDDGVFTTPL